MRLWPFKREKRESSFTDALVAQIQATAGGSVSARPSAVASLEIAAGLLGRAFAASKVEGPETLTRPLTPAFLSLVGRELIRAGEVLFLIDVEGGDLVLTPASDHEVFGDAEEQHWTYRATMAGPSRFVTRTGLTSDDVLHFRYSVEPSRPWRGVGPIQAAALAGRLSAETVKALADEAAGPRGHLMPTPKDGEDPSIQRLKADLREILGQGRLGIVESMSANWQAGRDAPMDWKPVRVGAGFGSPLVEAAERATVEVMAACGISPALFDPSAGNASREAFRQFHHTVAAPLGNLVAGELSRKLEADISFNWTELGAVDITARARGFNSMVQGGMDPVLAAEQSGLQWRPAATGNPNE